MLLILEKNDSGVIILDLRVCITFETIFNFIMMTWDFIIAYSHFCVLNKKINEDTGAFNIRESF